jgi:hypothetical protein
MSTGKQLPTDEDTTARRNVRNCLTTSRNVRQDLNCRCLSAKRLLKSVFIKVQINQITQRCYLWNYIYLDIHAVPCLVKQHKMI